jgi:hypothetical protein
MSETMATGQTIPWGTKSSPAEVSTQWPTNEDI